MLDIFVLTVKKTNVYNFHFIWEPRPDCVILKSVCCVLTCNRNEYNFHFREETVSLLLDNMLTGELNESVIVNGLSVIQTLLEFKRQG